MSPTNDAFTLFPQLPTELRLKIVSNISIFDIVDSMEPEL